MKKYHFLNNLLGWLVGIIAFLVYFLTVEPTASFWDCGEFIATSYKLQVGHPPGAPTFQLIGRIFSMFAFGNLEKVALMVNLVSVVSSALTILFLFWTISLLTKKLVLKKDTIPSTYQYLCIFGAAFIGALTYTFTDSFWFSAVEGEVYALSSLFTAITFWAILKWEEQAERKDNLRWMLLIAYLVGLSIGVHLLNLLAVPAIVFIYYFKKYKVSKKGILIVTLLSFVILGGILYLIIPWIVILAGNFELFFVNQMRLPFNSGTLIYLLLLVGLIGFGIYYTQKNNKFVWNIILKSFVFLLIGYSTYFILVIRSSAETPIDENNPSNAINLLAYLQREQYGDTPLFYGQYYSAPFKDTEKWKDKKPVYKKDENLKKYVVIDKRENSKPVYEPEFCTIFPRMWNGQEAHHIEGYESWGNVKGEKIKYARGGGQVETIVKPTFIENLKFFFSYQVSHMYIRYFMWNFVGRQNDIQGHGNILDGNWISGISFIDSRLGSQTDLPEYMKSNKARNKYYMLPFILGVLGLIYHIKNKPKDAFVVGLLFFMTGIAIILYLNQTPYQPRERDYAYVASFYAFSIWIGLGVLFISDLLKKILKNKVSSVAIATLASFLLVPVIMAKENWNDHDRSQRYAARDFAKNYLDSCEPNAILFTNGDNDTFPLWYIQEVEHYRTDVRVVNLSLLNTDWYVNMMKRTVYEGKAVPFSGSLDVVYLLEQNENTPHVDIKDLYHILNTQPERLKFKTPRGDVDYFPTKNFMLKVDSAKVVDNGTVAPHNADQIVDAIEWRINRTAIYKNAIMLLDLLVANNWERPIYFAITTGDDAYFGLQDYFQLDGLVYRLVPIKTANRAGYTGRIEPEILYNNMIKKFQWGNIEKQGVYADETIRRMCQNYRNNFFRLADTFIEKGNKEKAIEVLDFAMKIMPEENFPYNFFIVPISESYYKAEGFEKGDTLLNRLLDIAEENLNYYFSFKGNKAIQLNDRKEQELGIIQRIAQVSQIYKRDEIEVKAHSLFTEYYEQYISSIYKGMN